MAHSHQTTEFSEITLDNNFGFNFSEDIQHKCVVFAVQFPTCVNEGL